MNSKQLQQNLKQHKVKNIESQKNDKDIYFAQIEVKKYLEQRFPEYFTKSRNYYIILEKQISYKTIYQFIKKKGIRKELDWNFANRTIKPDGGVLYLKNYEKKDYQKVLLVAEVKKQGTNDIRQKQGKKKQAQGNAVERLGKNLTGIKTMLNHERITPFICFGWGCDFDLQESNFVLSKVSMMNEFYALNKIWVHKRDGDSNHNFFSPVSMYFRKNLWKKEEMFEIMKEIAETSLRYYLF